MKVLFLGIEYPDYVPDVLFHGITSLIGGEYVAAYPHKPSYFGDVQRAHNIMGDFIFDFKIKPENCIWRPGWDLSLAAHQWDLIIAHTQSDHKLILNLASRIKTVMVDGDDFTDINEELMDVSFLYAKREYLEDQHLKYEKMIPMPMGFIDLGYDSFRSVWHERDIDISFVGTNTSHYREKVNLMLRHLPHFPGRERKIVNFISDRPEWPCSHLEYRNILLRSKIAISVPGLGEDTYRFWEIPAHGACLLAIKPKISIPHPFTHMHDAVLADDIDHLSQLIPQLLQMDDQILQTIASQGFNKLWSDHTSTARARYLLQIVKDRGGPNLELKDASLSDDHKVSEITDRPFYQKWKQKIKSIWEV